MTILQPLRQQAGPPRAARPVARATGQGRNGNVKGARRLIPGLGVRDVA